MRFALTVLTSVCVLGLAGTLGLRADERTAPVSEGRWAETRGEDLSGFPHGLGLWNTNGDVARPVVACDVRTGTSRELDNPLASVFPLAKRVGLVRRRHCLERESGLRVLNPVQHLLPPARGTLTPGSLHRQRTITTSTRRLAHFGHSGTWFSRHAADTDKARILRSRIRHADDVARFFRSHPRLAATKQGRAVRWQHRRMGRWARRELRDVRTSMWRAAVVRRLDRAMAGSPMEGTGRTLERVAWQHRISPFFIVAVAGTEAGDGRRPGIHGCHRNPRNVWGLSSCGSGWYVPHFRSWRHAYTFYARFLRSRWPQATTAHHFYGYAACSPCWGRKTALWMRLLFGEGPGVRYP